MPIKTQDSHYPNRWTGRLIVGGLTLLILAMLAYSALKPDNTGRQTAEGMASVATMDASKVRADNTREADRARPLVD